MVGPGQMAERSCDGGEATRFQGNPGLHSSRQHLEARHTTSNSVMTAQFQMAANAHSGFPYGFDEAQCQASSQDLQGQNYCYQQQYDTDINDAAE